jgi:6-phosphogluconolactonase (cycloisomerase 2 family)
MTKTCSLHLYRWWLLGITAIAVLADCGGGGGGGGGNGANTGTAGVFARFAYAANYGDNTISIYAINAQSGQWRHWGYERTILVGGTNPYAIAIHPSGKFAYVTFDTSANIGVYTIDSRGTLTRMGTAVPAGGANPQSLAIDPSGRFAYVANRNAAGTTGTVSAFAIDNTTGALTLKQSYPTGGQPHSVAVHPSGKFVYVANFASSDINLFAIESTTGELTGKGTTSVGANTNPNYLAINPTGTYAYTANWGTGTVSVFGIDASNGALSKLTGSPYPTGGPNPSAITVDPSGTFIFVTNYDFANSGPSVSAFRIGASGVLEAVTAGPFATGKNPHHVAVDPSGNFVYVANLNDHTINAYTLDQATGALAPLAGAAPEVTARASPISFAITQGPKPLTVTPKYAYVANSGSSNVSQYAIGVDGYLTRMTPDKVLAGASPYSVVVDPLGRFAYVANADDNSVWHYMIGTNGALSPQTTTAIGDGTQPRAVTVDPSGKNLYVANYGAGTISNYVITTPTGELRGVAPGAISSGGTGPVSVTVDPSGRFVYVANEGGPDLSNPGNVSQYAIGDAGKLEPMTPATVPTGGRPRSVAVDPSGRYVYVANDGLPSAAIMQYAIGVTGVLEPMIPPTVPTKGPRSVAVDPSGRYVYVANWREGLDQSTVSQYTIGTNGTLSPMTPETVPAGTLSVFVTVDPSGRYAYAASGDLLGATLSVVSPYAIGANGALERMTSAALEPGIDPRSIAVVGALE